MGRKAEPAVLLLFLLVVVAIVAQADYMEIFYPAAWTSTAFIEGGSFAAQTVTTVGYGNWVPDEWASDSKTRPPDAGQRILRMKRDSIFMYLGAAVFTAAIGAWVTVFQRRS